MRKVSYLRTLLFFFLIFDFLSIALALPDSVWKDNIINCSNSIPPSVGSCSALYDDILLSDGFDLPNGDVNTGVEINLSFDKVYYAQAQANNLIQIGSAPTTAPKGLFNNVTMLSCNNNICTQVLEIDNFNNYASPCTGGGTNQFYNLAFNDSSSLLVDGFDKWIFRFYPRDTTGCGGSNDDLEMDEINISFLSFSDTPNQLPIINSFNITSLECFNNSFVFQDIDIDAIFNVTDLENDTIYYALSAQNQNVYTYLDFNQQDIRITQCKIAQPYANTGNLILNFFLNLINIFTSTCEEVPLSETSINTIPPEFTTIAGSCDILSNFSEFYITDLTNSENSSSNMLVLNPNCAKHRETYLNLRNELGYLSDISFQGKVYFSNVVNNTFNLTFYSNPVIDSRTLQLQFRKNDSGDLAVYNINSTGSTLLATIDTGTVNDYSYFNTYDYLIFSIDYNFSNNRYGFSYLDTALAQVNITNIDGFDSPKISRYMGLAIANDYVFLESLQVGGDILTPEFSTILPSTLTLHRDFDYIDVTLYATDSVHLNRDFVFSTSTLNINSCRYAPGGDYTSGSENQDYNLLNIIKNLAGNSMRDYLIAINAYQYFSWVIWMFFLGIFISTMVLQFKMSSGSSLGITPALLVSSASCALVSFLLSSWTNLIVFFSLLGFTMSGLIIKHIVGGS